MTGKKPVRDRLLNAAAELFYSQGVAATGIDKITARAGVAKMSLYNNFSSKADLVETYLESRVVEWQSRLAEKLRQATTPQDRILAVFDSYLDYARPDNAVTFRGCGLLNAAAELPVSDPGRALVASQKDEVVHFFAENLADMMGQDLATVRETAQHLSFVLEGGMARAGLDGSDERLKLARTIAVSILAHLPRRTTRMEAPKA
ncbi:TetR/AcrR family transcriptional regulator [Rhizobium sp. 32-5/1]|uniref:TetR/AcrR family transcriptional regulator n=1 Tax=Rhizobium sp. 32-5/1 TaxID=3019602 RepID=UPI00240D4C33|nr:TetR/AcrR family transcriptional regulator [Rhizobium sp. 32-5/1]WEZ84026.1 TetR/AcrR family transcriptional regulator [Rhizobium sp. 32-5/1]